MPSPIYFSGAAVRSHDEELWPALGEEYIPLSSMTSEQKSQAFGMWLGIVYVNRIPPPPRLDSGYAAEDDPIIVFDFHRDYEAGGWRKLNRGLNMEETWLLLELSLGERFLCVINSAVPAQPMERIECKTVSDAAACVEAALAYFRRKKGIRRRPLLALVTDGVFGHCVSLVDADPAETCFAFNDPWPGRSLLCKENNAADIEALSLGKHKVHFPGGRTLEVESWQLSREEFTRVVVALMIPVLDLG